MAISGLLALLVWGRTLRNSAALWLLLAVILVQFVSWGLGYLHHPQWVADNPQIDRLAKLYIFIGVAWWLGGSTRRTLAIWSLALIGYFAALFIRGDGMAEFLRGVGGDRVDFDIRNAQHTAMYFGTGLLGLLAFARRSLALGSLAIVRRFAWALATIICLTGVIITQTRGVWLALIVAMPLMATLFSWWYLRFHPLKHARSVLIGSFLAVMTVGIPAANFGYEAIADRLEQERPTIESILAGDFSEIPYNSAGIRFHTWRAATEWIAERPLVGWGGAGRSLAIDETEWMPQWVKDQYGHLHNYFLELFVAYGLLGVGVFVALAFWVGRGTWLAWRGGVMPNDMALFGVSFFIYWVIVNQFESYNSFWTGVFVHNLVVGGLVTHYWRWQLIRKRDDDSQLQPTSQPE
ncbi:O-antigen ligase family protein [Halomonas sp. McH1-25]|uniref:O-antigen ligase family protein n=1 Tax=unclassified Halomonas TaxID=2609666 RepID=UPI001EF40E29|nr:MULTISPECIES: O-antigen ligase family protein [unclassified Halomonas]MCG7598279.1 O-antigen ligase family protein [Halomonas sp. McH1-25]MCP1340938.1 O-antigen ligase family protein [Halomonas sp. FL8]MCP1362509.1 O-antigen ligase family protein [Halomonas sp. BBD45]MCP1363980.1 O-antigen ligase family protein [Halomonas sp. BBD48]